MAPSKPITARSASSRAHSTLTATLMRRHPLPDSLGPSIRWTRIKKSQTNKNRFFASFVSLRKNRINIFQRNRFPRSPLRCRISNLSTTCNLPPGILHNLAIRAGWHRPHPAPLFSSVHDERVSRVPRMPRSLPSAPASIFRPTPARRICPAGRANDYLAWFRSPGSVGSPRATPVPLPDRRSRNKKRKCNNLVLPRCRSPQFSMIFFPASQK